MKAITLTPLTPILPLCIAALQREREQCGAMPTPQSPLAPACERGSAARNATVPKSPLPPRGRG